MRDLTARIACAMREFLPNLMRVTRVSDGNEVDSATCLMDMCADQQSAAQRSSNNLKAAASYAVRTLRRGDELVKCTRTLQESLIDRTNE